MILNELEQRILNKREEREIATVKPFKGAHAIIWVIALILSFLIDPDNALVWVPILFLATACSVFVQLRKTNIFTQLRFQIRADREDRDEFISTALYSRAGTDFCLSREIRDIDAEFAIAVDKVHKEWLLIFGNKQEVFSYHFNDLISFELYQDGKSLISGTAGEALAGGLIFGAVGAIAGASSAKDIVTNCTDLHINLSINDVKHPHHQLPFIIETVSNDSNEYKYEIGFANEILSLLAFIKANSETEANDKSASIEEPATDKYDEIKKVKELLDIGIITQDEFEAKKKQLLGL